MAADADFDFSLLLPKKLSTVDKLAESAAKIAFHNFEWRYFTLLFYNSTLLSGLELFVQLYDKSVVIGRGAFYPRFAEETRQYILFGTDIPNLNHMLQWMQIYKFDNTGRYVVICQSEEHNCDETEAVKTFWNYRIVNVIFIRKSPNRDNIIAYTYSHPDDCKSVFPVRMKSFDFCIKYDMRCYGMFPVKFRDLHGCRIIVSTFIQPPYMKITDGNPSGIDGDLLLILAEGLNATLKMMTPRRGDGWGALDTNGVWFGSLGDIYDDVANFSMTFPAITMTRYLGFHMSINYNFVTVAWLTHPTESLPSSLKLLHPLTPITQIAIVITFVFVVISALFTRSHFWDTFRRKLKMSRPRSSVVFYSWTICMGLPINKFPKKTAVLIMVLFWIWYAFLIRTIYQTSLISSLMNDQPYSNVETLEDMVQAKYPFGGGGALKDFYIDDFKVHSNWIDLNNSEITETFKKLSNGMKFGLAVNLEHANTFVRQRRGTLHVLREKVVVSPTVIYFRKFSPLVAAVNRVLRRLIEAGFPDKLYKNYTLMLKSVKEDHDEPINLEHYTGCYAILLVGWFWSTVFFIYEVCVKKFNRCNFLGG